MEPLEITPRECNNRQACLTITAMLSSVHAERPVCPGCYPTKLEVYRQNGYARVIMVGEYHNPRVVDNIVTVGEEEELFRVPKDGRHKIILVWSNPAMTGNRSIHQMRETNSELPNTQFTHLYVCLTKCFPHPAIFLVTVESKDLNIERYNYNISHAACTSLF